MAGRSEGNDRKSVITSASESVSDQIDQMDQIVREIDKQIDRFRQIRLESVGDQLDQIDRQINKYIHRQIRLDRLEFVIAR